MTAVLERRWAWVLDAMTASGDISARQRADARFPAFRFYPPGNIDGQRQYLIDVAASEAADRLGITEDQLARGGYTVHTTFDLALQDATAELVGGASSAKGARLHTAVVGIKPGDGAIRVLYGGADYACQPFNDALSGAVEAGTALRPFNGTRLGRPLDRLIRTAAPTPVQVTAVYAVLGARGRYATPYTVTKITRGGRTVHTAEPAVRAAMTQVAAKTATDRLRAFTTSPDGPPSTHTGGAGSSVGRRTAWHTGHDAQLALTVALFAEHPAKGKHPARVARLSGLTGSRTPTAFAALTVTDLWKTAHQHSGKGSGQR